MRVFEANPLGMFASVGERRWRPRTGESAPWKVDDSREQSLHPFILALLPRGRPLARLDGNSFTRSFLEPPTGTGQTTRNGSNRVHLCLAVSQLSLRLDGTLLSSFLMPNVLIDFRQAFILMTLLVALSIRPIRDRYYDMFYCLHLLLVPSTIIMSALHHPPLWWWCWAALGIWLGERMWRLTRWLYTNGFVGGNPPSLPITPYHNKPIQRQKESWEMHNVDAEGHLSRRADNPHEPDSRTAYYSHVGSLSSLHLLLPSSLSPLSYIPPPGYAHIELLAGRTIRVRIVTSGYLTWAPGQHFLLSMPSVSKFHSHPFTVASIADEQMTTDDGRIILFLIRAKAGWTKDLWDTVVRLNVANKKHPQNEVRQGMPLPSIGVVMRAWVDGPFGSSARTNWGTFSSVLIVSGGSGVSFGLSVLEYLCLCMSGRDGKYLGGNTGWGKTPVRTERIRFVWMLREFCESFHVVCFFNSSDIAVIFPSACTMVCERASSLYGPPPSTTTPSRSLCHEL